MPIRFSLLVAIASLLLSNHVAAQGWSFDARQIALGGSRGGNLATALLEEQRTYRTIVLPFGLIQVLGNLNIYNPNSDTFNLARAIGYAASPLHFVIGRGSPEAGKGLGTDIEEATLSRDLNHYRGFDPPSRLRVEEFASPTWGRTMRFREGTAGTFHAVRLGAGPYLSMRDIGTIDEKLIDLLASDTDVVLPNTQFLLTNSAQGQVALALTGGYRGRLAWPGADRGSDRDGLYLATDFHYLQGFRYEDGVGSVRIDTDADGLISELPPKAPLVINRLTSTSGRGLSVDLGVTAVVNRWELGFGVSGLANRITWTGVSQTSYTRRDLTSGDSDFVTSPKTRAANARVELPTDYRGTIEYGARAWSALGQVGHGISGTSFHVGLERRFTRIDLRGGMRESNGNWTPTGGMGFRLGPRASLDVAAFRTTAIIERTRQLAIAASIRLNPAP